MRRVRTSTWILVAIFLVTLVTYLRFRPPTAHAGSTPGVVQPSRPKPAPASSPQKTTPRPTSQTSPAGAVSPSATPPPTRVPATSPASVATPAPSASSPTPS
jgi:hypothetical protein